MNYQSLRNELETLIYSYYEAGVPIMDIRAALRVADLTAEQISMMELREIVKKMSEDKP